MSTMELINKIWDMPEKNCVHIGEISKQTPDKSSEECNLLLDTLLRKKVLFCFFFFRGGRARLQSALTIDRAALFEEEWWWRWSLSNVLLHWWVTGESSISPPVLRGLYSSLVSGTLSGLSDFYVALFWADVQHLQWSPGGPSSVFSVNNKYV